MIYQTIKTEDTPEIKFDINQLEITGRSLPENVTDFYGELLKIIDNHNPTELFKIIIKLEYFNTASSKILLDIFLKYEDKNIKDKILVEWYAEDDEDLEEAGIEYSEIVDLTFNIIK